MCKCLLGGGCRLGAVGGILGARPEVVLPDQCTDGLLKYHPWLNPSIVPTPATLVPATLWFPFQMPVISPHHG